MKTTAEFLQEAKQLPNDQRLTLVARLLAVSEPKATDEVEHVWDDTIRQRIERYDQGLSASRPAGEVLADLDQKLAS